MKIVGVGAGGHGKVVLDILKQTGEFEIVGFVDARPDLVGSNLLDVPVLGNDDLLPTLFRQGVTAAFIGVGAATDTRPRTMIYDRLRDIGFDVVSAIHPRSIVSKEATIGMGVNIMAGVIVNPAAVVGDNVILNTGVVVEHDCVVGNHAHLATGTRLAGNVSIGEGAFLGIGSCVLQGVTVGSRAVVGAGAVVTRPVGECCVAVGIPARVLRTLEP